MPMWVFGYGSLIWKADFPYEEKLPGYVKGFQRRFYQHSTDHRGIPDKPGRVVTLIEGDKEDEVWGVVYKIADENIDYVMDHLDHRERGGYQRINSVFYPKDKALKPFEITIYLATTSNFQYAGEASIEAIAAQIASAVGPSGTNADYLFNLAKMMREIAPDVNDDHLFALENKVKDLQSTAKVKQTT